MLFTGLAIIIHNFTFRYDPTHVTICRNCVLVLGLGHISEEFVLNSNFVTCFDWVVTNTLNKVKSMRVNK